MAFAHTVELLEEIVSHIAANPGKLPLESLALLQANIRDEAAHYTAAELQQLNVKIKSIRSVLKQSAREVSPIIKKLMESYNIIFDRLVFAYEQRNQGEFSDKGLHDSSAPTSFLEHNLTAGQMSWEKLKKKLVNLSWRNAFANKAIYNSLTALISLNDSDFLDALYEYKIVFSEEMGHLAIERVKDIIRQKTALNYDQRDQETERQLKLAHRCFRQFTNPTFSGGSFDCNVQALQSEITKLALHALIHPNKKKIWIGTARAVDAMIVKYPGEAMYFNPGPRQHTWGLNRAWLQAAVSMKYEVRLVEQHFPNMERAILSGDPACFLIALAAESRPAKEDNIQMHSQYHGGNSPTATPQEILVLMEMHCVAKKNSDGSISFYSPIVCDDNMMLNASSKDIIMKRSHSSPDLQNVAPPPPLLEHADHFRASKK